MLKPVFRFLFITLFTFSALNDFAQETMVHFQQHTVKQGETVESITQQYNIDQMDFLLLNDFPTTINLQPGTVVLIKIINDEEFEQLAAIDMSSVSGFRQSKQVIDLAPSTAKKPEPIPVVPKREPSTKDIEYGPRGTTYHVSRNGYHIVEKDQTCYRIAIIYGLNLEFLLELNNLHSYLIIPGQKLRVSRDS